MTDYQIVKKEDYLIAKKEVEQLVSQAKSSAHRLYEMIECDPFKLVHFVGDIEGAKGAAAIFIKINPDKNDNNIWKDANDAQLLGHKAINKFISECYCRKKV